MSTSRPAHSPEPWRVTGTGYGPARIQDARGQPLMTFDAGGIPRPNDNANAARAAACVNFLAGVPAEALTAADLSDERALALAVLRGDECAAYGLADEIVEHRKQPDGFVTRAELVAVLRAVVAASQWGAPPLELGAALADAGYLLDRLGDGLTPAAVEVERVVWPPEGRGEDA